MTLNNRRNFRRYRVQFANSQLLLTAFRHDNRAGVHAPCAELISKCGSKPTSPTQTAINFPKSRLHGVYSSAVVSSWRAAKENSMKNVFLSQQRNLSLAFPFIFIIDSKTFGWKAIRIFRLYFRINLNCSYCRRLSFLLLQPKSLKLCLKNKPQAIKKVFISYFLLERTCWLEDQQFSIEGRWSGYGDRVKQLIYLNMSVCDLKWECEWTRWEGSTDFLAIPIKLEWNRSEKCKFNY